MYRGAILDVADEYDLLLHRHLSRSHRAQTHAPHLLHALDSVFVERCLLPSCPWQHNNSLGLDKQGEFGELLVGCTCPSCTDKTFIHLPIFCKIHLHVHPKNKLSLGRRLLYGHPNHNSEDQPGLKARKDLPKMSVKMCFRAGPGSRCTVDGL